MLICRSCGNRWMLDECDVEVDGEEECGPSYMCPACGEAGDEEA